ncbi:MAG: glucosyltransferase domain-containing protein [Clostridia bacterium]|nr:glucosyltransferase domain-containing protein [Clostridia bacterium]
MQMTQGMDLEQLRNFARRHARFLWCLAASLLTGLCAHAYFYTGLGFSQDSLMLYTNDVDWQISLGRFMIPVYYYLRGRFTVPWLLGLYCILYAAISASLIASMMNIRKAGHLLLLCGIIMTNAAVTAQTATYVHVIDIYMLAFLMATLSVWFLWRFRFGFLVGIPLLMVGVGLYPAYFAAAAALCVLLVIQQLLDNAITPKQLWLTIAKALLMLLCALLLYAAGVRVALWLSGTPLSQGYNGISGVGDFTGYSVMELLEDLYRYVVRFLKNPTANAPMLIRWCNLLMGVAAMVQLVRLVVLRRPVWWRLLLVGVALVLLPLAANITYFLSKGMFHGVMTMPLYLLYLFILLTHIWAQDAALAAKDSAADNTVPKKCWLRRLAIAVIPLLLCIWMVDNVQFANASYLKKRLEAQSTLSVMTRVIDRIENTEGYRPRETAVVFIGDLNLNSALNPSRIDYHSLKQTGDRVPGYEYEYAISYPWSYRYYMNYLLGYPIRLGHEGLIEQYTANETVQAMPAFPDVGCIQWIGEDLIVKLSNKSY